MPCYYLLSKGNIQLIKNCIGVEDPKLLNMIQENDIYHYRLNICIGSYPPYPQKKKKSSNYLGIEGHWRTKLERYPLVKGRSHNLWQHS